MVFETNIKTTPLHGINPGQRYALVITGDEITNKNPVHLLFQHSGDPVVRKLPGFSPVIEEDTDEALTHEFLSFTSYMWLEFENTPTSDTYISLIPFFASDT
jgi:hypothetical protein